MRIKLTASKINISVVVPIYNEVENLPILCDLLCDVLSETGRSYEVILVDDGSRDGSRKLLRELAEQDAHLKVVLFRKNFGQSAAMAAGFRQAKGEIVVAMDGDLQNDPSDIPNLIAKIEEGYDVVSGWRKNRKDTLIVRKVPSRIANKLICSITDVQLHDTGCSLKAFRKEVIKRIRLYGELHRFIPGLARVEGANITELVVKHHPRRFGVSKYNLTRTFRVLMDLTSLNLFLKYLRNPMRFFGKIGLVFHGLALIGSIWLGVHMIHLNTPFENLNIILTTIFLLWIAGFQMILFGLVGSLIVKTGDRRGATLSPFLAIKKGEMPSED